MKYVKLFNEVRSLSTPNRNQSDQKIFEAIEVLKKDHVEMELLVRERTEKLNDIIKKQQNQIATQKQVENKLIEKNRSLKKEREPLFESQWLDQVGDWYLDVVTNKVLLSIECCRILGLDNQSAILPVTDFVKLVNPDDRKKVYAAFLNFYRIGGQANFQFRINRPDGEIRFLTTSVYVEYDVNHKLSKLIGATTDSTLDSKDVLDLKYCKKKLRTLFEFSGDAMFILDDNTIVDCNKAALKMYGIKNKNALLKLTPDMLISEKHIEGKTAKEVIEANNKLAYKNGSFKGEEIHTRMDGALFNAEVLITPMQFDGKSVFQVIINDISKSKQVELKLVESNEKLRELAAGIEKVREEERTFISREIHDELGHTLTAVLIDLHLLVKKTEFQTNDSFTELNRMIGLVNHSIKTMGKIATDLRPGILDKFGLEPAIEWQLDQFKKRTKIKCTADIQEFDKESTNQLSKEIITALFRVFQEILNNIIKHAEATSITVILKKEKKHLRLFVSDNGKGIEEDDVKRAGALGVLGMEERVSIIGGTFSITGSKNNGTQVEVLIPISS
jgi:PAS domain S-box-containing protein